MQAKVITRVLGLCQERAGLNKLSRVHVPVRLTREIRNPTYFQQNRCLHCSRQHQFHCSRQHQAGSGRSSNTSSSGLAGYWRSLKWVPIPLSVGFGYICYQQYGHIKKREERHIRGARSVEESLAKEWQVHLMGELLLKCLAPSMASQCQSIQKFAACSKL